MATHTVRLLVIGPGPGLSDDTARALEGWGIRVTGQGASIGDSASLDRADVLLLGDEQALRDVIEAHADAELPSVVVRSFDDTVVAALRHSGAPGWAIVDPDSTVDELAAAVLAAARGFAVRPAPPAHRATKVRVRDRPSDLERLTDREHDVLALVSEGLPNKAIAARLGISEHTVKFHLSSIFSKLGVSSRTEAVRRGVRSGLIEL